MVMVVNLNRNQLALASEDMSQKETRIGQLEDEILELKKDTEEHEG